MGRKAHKPEDVWKFIDKRSENECWPWGVHLATIKKTVRGARG